MSQGHGAVVVAVVLVLTAACAASPVQRVEPAACRDLPPEVPPARLTEVVAAAATTVATASVNGPAGLATAASTIPAVEFSRALMAGSEVDPSQAANLARSTEDLRIRRELATQLPGDPRLAQLEAAFKHGSAGELAAFLKGWQAEVGPRTDLQRLSAAERNVYALFTEFMRPAAFPVPADPDLRGRAPPGLPKDARFVVVPTRLHVRCVKNSLADLPDPFHCDDPAPDRFDAQLEDFRPPLNLGGAVPLYLTAEREAILTSFLGTNSGILPPDEAGFPNYPEDDTTARAEFWRQLVPLIGGHWGGWHLETDPLVSFLFSEDMTAAWVQFQQGYQGGTARAELRNGRWVITETQWEWIE